ncbi:YbhB/YbcL family Raf kinase inhibitor-like protein [Nocardia sp. NPDC058058]|uniref:YbhB/YbcL family Raf kinase inhibitor-like protein n=1 Tax=Nocardia sp. NPDC058058 TaxID=3346317 RepID=UPI0036D82237
MNTIARIASAAVVASGLLSVAACGTDGESAPAAQPTAAGVTVRSVAPAGAATFEVNSPDVRGGTFGADNFAGAFGCTAANHAPRVRWSGAPAAAKSFAVTMFDQDAPTGSGFWHWINWDIAPTATEFGTGVTAVTGTNDAGAADYLGPCPPSGDKAHTYRITVLALDVPRMDLPAATPPAVASFSMSSHIIGIGQLSVSAQRP